MSWSAVGHPGQPGAATSSHAAMATQSTPRLRGSMKLRPSALPNDRVATPYMPIGVPDGDHVMVLGHGSSFCRGHADVQGLPQHHPQGGGAPFTCGCYNARALADLMASAAVRRLEVRLGGPGDTCDRPPGGCFSTTHPA